MKRPIHPGKLLLLAAFLTASAVVSSGGCQGRSPVGVPRTLVVDADANGKVIAVEDMDMASIKLFGNASTGYQWTLVSVEGNSLKYTGKLRSEVESANPKHLDGGDTAYDYADFHVVGPGKTKITLEYRRPGTSQPSAETFSATFDVHGKQPAGAPSTSIH
jgi:predicted secreted protein